MNKIKEVPEQAEKPMKSKSKPPKSSTKMSSEAKKARTAANAARRLTRHLKRSTRSSDVIRGMARAQRRDGCMHFEIIDGVAVRLDSYPADRTGRAIFYAATAQDALNKFKEKK